MVTKFDLIDNKPNHYYQIYYKNSTANALKGGCLLKPQFKLLPQAKASIVSKGKFVFDNEGINVHNNKCEKINRISYLYFFYFHLNQLLQFISY